MARTGLVVTKDGLECIELQASEILGVRQLIGDEKVAARLNGAYYYRGQVEGLIRVAARRAAWQTAQTLADYLERVGEDALAEQLRGMTADELADGIDVSAAIEARKEV